MRCFVALGCILLLACEVSAMDFYSTSQIRVISFVRESGGKATFVYQPLMETAFHSPGIIVTKGVVVRVVRCRHDQEDCVEGTVKAHVDREFNHTVVLDGLIGRTVYLMGENENDRLPLSEDR